MDALASVSFLVTVAGFAVSIWQIVKTRRVAKAAQEAAQEATQGIQRNVLLTDTVLCDRLLGEIMSHLRNQKHESALLRTSDLSARLIQLRHVYPAGSSGIDFQSILAHLAVLQKALERHIFRPDGGFDAVKANTKLAQFSAELNDCIGREKFVPKGDHHDS
jgi:hypothetical protein